MTDVILRPFEGTDKAAYAAIYEASFPLSERKPLSYMTDAPTGDCYELLTVSTPKTSVAGLVILAYATVEGRDFALLDYLAVTPACRGSGIGHAVLALVKAHCRARGARLFLEIEAPDDRADNAEQRIRRKAFYQSCGLDECGVTAQMYGTVMELLCYPEDRPYLNFAVYAALTKACFPPDMAPPILIK